MSSRHRQFTSLRSYFPLKTVKNVVDLVQRQIESNQCDLAFLSLLMGYIEHTLTCSGVQFSNDSTTYTTNYDGHHASDENTSETNSNGSGNRNGNGKSSPCLSDDHPIPEDPDELEIPWVKWEHIEPLYKKFVSQIKGAVNHHPKKATREVIKKVIECIWSNLTRGYYTNKPHLQTLFTYLTEDKLDRFGVSYSVAAACQVLELNDVRLALSEDHAWIVFGEPGNEQTAEISWRGKGSEDRRGQSVVMANCWLYLNGYPVLCTPPMVFAALVASMNPNINSSAESCQIAAIQHKVLWILYHNGFLAKYPMGIDNLGDLEEVTTSSLAMKDALGLFQEAIDVNKKFYENHHVYPYCFLAGFYFRQGRFKDALQLWAEAASVIRRYSYTRDDEEIYKEFLEIANDLIPHMVKVVSAGGCEPAGVSKVPLLQDPECFASLLAFYDGLCGWEEESPTPVLHIGWAKPFVATISKFTSHVRNKAHLRIRDSRYHTKNNNRSPSHPIVENQSDPNTTDSKYKEDVSPKSVETQGKEPASDKELSKSPSSPIRTPDEIIKSIEDGLKEDGERIEQNLKSGTYDSKDELDPQKATSSTTKSNELNTNETDQTHPNGHPDEAVVYLESQKMIGLRDLLLAEKLNTSAIQLQLTAQSQVHISKRPRLGSFGSNNQPAEFDFLATTTIATSLSSVSGVRSSKRTRRD